MSDSIQPMYTWELDKDRLFAILAPRYAWKLSMNKICKDSGLTGARTSRTWSDGAIRKIAEHYGIEPESFATRRAYRRLGPVAAPVDITCPGRLSIPEAVRPLVVQAAIISGKRPEEWMLDIIYAAALHTFKMQGGRR
jgi:hypothetical protein